MNIGSMTTPLWVMTVPRSIQMLIMRGLGGMLNSLTFFSLGCQVKVHVELRVCCRMEDHTAELVKDGRFDLRKICSLRQLT